MTIDIKQKNIICFGCGGTMKATLYYMEVYFNFDYKKVYIYDLINYKDHPVIKKYLDNGSSYIITDLNKNYKKIISKLKKGDIIIDLSNRTNSIEFIKECFLNDIFYVNTSMECNETVEQEKKRPDFDITFQDSHNDILELKYKYPEKHTSICLECGQNPGMINHYIKCGIDFLAKYVLENNKFNDEQLLELKIHRKNNDFANMCRMLKIRIIHCSETDSAKFTTETNDNKKSFNNTWCCDGLLDESSLDCEFAWGSHEKGMPENSELLYDNIIKIKKPAYYCYSESYVPDDGIIVGANVSHGENISMPSFLAVGNYSPTCHYVYRWSPICQNSFKKFSIDKIMNKSVPNPHVLNNYQDKFTSIDKVGALIISEDFPTVWCGSILNSNFDEFNSATTNQVVAGVMSHLSYIIENPNLGVIFPEHCDTDYIMNRAVPLLGKFFLNFVDYKPKSFNYVDLMRSKKDFDKQFLKM